MSTKQKTEAQFPGIPYCPEVYEVYPQGEKQAPRLPSPSFSVPPPAPRCPSDGSLAAGRASMTEKQGFVHKAEDRSAISWYSILSGSLRGLSTGGETGSSSSLSVLLRPSPRTAMPVRRQPCCRQGEHDGETRFCPQSSRQKRCFLEFRTVRKCTRFIHRGEQTPRLPSPSLSVPPPAPRCPSDGSLAAGRASMTEKQGFVHKAADRSAVSWNSVLSGSVRDLSTGGSRLRVFPLRPSPSLPPHRDARPTAALLPAGRANRP